MIYPRSREDLQRWRYNLVPDHLIGEILSKRWADNAIPFLAMVATVIGFGMAIPGFFKPSSLVESTRQLGEFSIVVTGLTVVFLYRHYNGNLDAEDLSKAIGSQSASTSRRARSSIRASTSPRMSASPSTRARSTTPTCWPRESASASRARKRPMSRNTASRKTGSVWRSATAWIAAARP